MSRSANSVLILPAKLLWENSGWTVQPAWCHSSIMAVNGLLSNGAKNRILFVCGTEGRIQSAARLSIVGRPSIRSGTTDRSVELYFESNSLSGRTYEAGVQASAGCLLHLNRHHGCIVLEFIGFNKALQTWIYVADKLLTWFMGAFRYHRF